LSQKSLQGKTGFNGIGKIRKKGASKKADGPRRKWGKRFVEEWGIGGRKVSGIHYGLKSVRGQNEGRKDLLQEKTARDIAGINTFSRGR